MADLVGPESSVWFVGNAPVEHEGGGEDGAHTFTMRAAVMDDDALSVQQGACSDYAWCGPLPIVPRRALTDAQADKGGTASAEPRVLLRARGINVSIAAANAKKL